LRIFQTAIDALQYVDGLYIELIRKSYKLERVPQGEQQTFNELKDEIKDLERLLRAESPKSEELDHLAREWSVIEERN
jgi:hypothetical protein